MSTLSVLQLPPSVAQQTSMFAIQLAFSPVAKDPKQIPYIFNNLNAAVGDIVSLFLLFFSFSRHDSRLLCCQLTRGNWATNAEAVKSSPEASHIIFKLRDGYKTVQSQNPTVRIEMPAEFFTDAKLCKAVQVLRHPVPTIPSVAPPASAVPPPIVAQPTPVLPGTDEGSSAATETPRGRPKV